MFSVLLAVAQHPLSLNTCCFSVTSVTAKADALRCHISMERANQTGLYCGRACSYVTVFLKRPLLSLAYSTAVKVKLTLFNPLKAELNPICYLLALLGAHHFLHVSRIRVKSLTLRLLMSYIYKYMEHLFLMFLDHTQRRTTVGRTPLDE